MSPNITEKIEALVEAIRAEAPDNAITFRLFVNSEEHSVEVQHRTPGSLKADGISMRNLRGEWIEEPKQ